ncbi:MAG: redoxin domain-containing protein [Gammaproteobacteria bacterium]|nr:redoxin domain-containing protein [Gammaproteobacteria bacterium]
MNIRGLLTLLLAGLAGPLCAAPQIGQAAPDFAGTDTAGQVQRLSDYHGRTVVLEWTNHDCPYVRKHYGSGTMQALQRDAVAQGVVWLSIISSAPGKQGHVSAAQADALTRDRDASPSAVVLDEQGEIGRLYGAKTTPHMFVVDADGVLRYMGGIDSISSADPADIATAQPYVRTVLAQLASGEPVQPAVTRPYGCSVKY